MLRELPAVIGAERPVPEDLAASDFSEYAAHVVHGLAELGGLDAALVELGARRMFSQSPATSTPWRGWVMETAPWLLDLSDDQNGPASAYTSPPPRNIARHDHRRLGQYHRIGSGRNPGSCLVSKIAKRRAT